MLLFADKFLSEQTLGGLATAFKNTINQNGKRKIA